LERIRENINISTKESLGYYELKTNKPLFDEKGKVKLAPEQAVEAYRFTK
jgi:hypothetical protein